MSVSGMTNRPKLQRYDVVIVGGAMYGSSVAWFLSQQSSFTGSVLVVERDPSYEFASTSHTNSCMRQQFTNETNVRISQFAAEYVKNFRSFVGDDERVPDIVLQSFGYMYLADNHAFAESLREVQSIQQQLGAGTRYMNQQEILDSYPFYNVEDIIGANHNVKDEGYFDGATIFDWWRRLARENGVEYISNQVIGMELNDNRSQVQSVALQSGEKVHCGTVVNASGPRAIATSRMAGIEIPVEPRKRYTFIFDAEKPLDRDLPLTIDPSGIHVRSDGKYYMAGCRPDCDHAVDYDDFQQDHGLWEEKVWPVLAHRIPQFEAIKLVNSWVGHYAYNTFDQNAIVGPHSRVANFIFVNGFSGHGLQQSPAIGRGVAEWINSGSYQSLDLSEFHYDRLENNKPFDEKAII